MPITIVRQSCDSTSLTSEKLSAVFCTFERTSIRFVSLLLAGCLLCTSGLSFSQNAKTIEFTEEQLQNLIAMTQSLNKLQLDSTSLEAASPEEQMQALKQNVDVMSIYNDFGYSPEDHLSSLSSIQQAMRVIGYPAEITSMRSTLEEIEESISSLQLQQTEVKNQIDALFAEYKLVPESNVNLVTKHQAEILNLFAEPSE